MAAHDAAGIPFFRGQLDPEGQVLWAASGIGDSIAAHPDGTMVVGGNPTTKYALDGRPIWQVEIPGGTKDAAVHTDGTIALVGYVAFTHQIGDVTLTPVPGDDGNGDIWVAKLDTGGRVLWVRSMGGVGSDIPDAVARDAAGDVLFAGEFGASFTIGNQRLTSMAETDWIVAKVSGASGVPIGAASLPGPLSERATDIQLEPSGQALVAGRGHAITRFDGKTGAVLQTSAVNPDEYPLTVTSAPDGKSLLIGGFEWIGRMTLF